jgi:hypothetical protein
MTKCPDCRKRVSKRAVNCPNCGYPFRSQTIERTAKRWKGMQVLATLVAVGGMLAMKAGQPFVGVPFLALAALIGGAASFGAWWENG